MEVVTLGCRPPLKGRRVATHGAEVAVVQPVLDGLFLLDARPLCVLGVRVTVSAERELRAFLRCAPVVVLGPSRSDQQDVPDLDVAALCRGPDVDALVFTDRCEILVADCVRCCCVVLDSLCICP